MAKFPTNAANTKWASKKPVSEKKETKESEDWKTIYDNVKADRQQLRTQEVEKVKEKL